MGVSVAQTLPIALIRRNGGTQARAGLNEETVAEYAEDLEGGASFPPVTVFYDGDTYWLADGFHRVAAHARVGLDEVTVEIEQGDQRAAILWACGANDTHGLRRTREDKRRAVDCMLSDDEWVEWSDRQVAKACKVSRDLVKARRKVTGRNASQSGERTYIHNHSGKAVTMRTDGIAQSNRERLSEPTPINNPSSKPEVHNDGPQGGAGGRSAPEPSSIPEPPLPAKQAPAAVTEGAPAVAPIDEAEARRRALEALKADVRAVCGGWLAQLKVLGVANDALSDVLDPTLGLVAAVEAAIVGGPTEAIVAAWVSIEGRGTIGGGEISSDLDQGSTSSGHTDQRDGGLGEERPDRGRCSPAKARREAEKAVYAEQAEQVVALWGEVYDRPSVALKPDSKSGKLRRKAVVARLKEGYPLEDVLDAVRGCALSPYHMGQNPEGTPHNDLTTICRDGGQIEKFSDLYRNGEKRRTLTPSHSGQRPDHHCNERWKNPDGSWKSGDEAAEGWDFEYWEQKGAIYSGGSNSGGYGG